MKRAVPFALACVMLAVLFSQMSKADAYYYSDTKSHWAAEYINNVTNVIYQNENSTLFYPNSNVSRGDFVVMLAFFLGADSEIYARMGTSVFQDVPANTILCGAVNWAKAKGVTSGVSATQFAPDAKLTREQICTFIYEACRKFSFPLAYRHAAITFTDDANISSWAKQAVKVLTQAGIISGRPDGSFGPKSLVSKAETCTIKSELMHYSIGRVKQNSEKSGTVLCGFNDFGWVTFNYTVDYKEYGLTTADNKVQYYYRSIDQTTTSSRSVGAQAGIIFPYAAYNTESGQYKRMTMSNNPNKRASGGYFSEQYLEDHTHIILAKSNSMTAQTAYGVIGTSDSILAPVSKVIKFSLNY